MPCVLFMSYEPTLPNVVATAHTWPLTTQTVAQPR